MICASYVLTRATANAYNSMAVWSVVHVDRSFAFQVVFCRSLFVLFSVSFRPFYCLSILEIRLVITPLASSVYLGDTSCDYTFGIFSLSWRYVLWSHLWHLQCIILEIRLVITPLASSVYLGDTSCDYTFGIYSLSWRYVLWLHLWHT